MTAPRGRQPEARTEASVRDCSARRRAPLHTAHVSTHGLGDGRLERRPSAQFADGTLTQAEVDAGTLTNAQADAILAELTPQCQAVIGRNH